MGTINVHGLKFTKGDTTEGMLDFYNSFYLPFAANTQHALIEREFDHACELFVQYRSEMYRRNFKKSQSNFAPSVVQEFIGMIINAVFNDGGTNKQKIQNFDFQAEKKLPTKTTTYTYADGSENEDSNKNQDVAVFCKKDSSPVIVVECKTYIDATMLSAFRDVCRTLQDNYPLCTKLVVAETCALSDGYDRFSDPSIDGMFILSRDFKREKTNEGVADLVFKPEVIEQIYYAFQNTLNNYPMNGKTASTQFRADGFWFKNKFT